MKLSPCTDDLSVIYLTLNRLPAGFSAYQIATLQQATDAPIISVSRQPMSLGTNLIDTDTPGYLNIYRQMLRAAKIATTPYVAIAEDDVLYPPDHFTYRPPLDTFAYNQHRWALFTWGEPLFSWRNRKSNCTLIAPRELLIEALEERFAKWGDDWPLRFIGEVGRDRVERGLEVTIRRSVEYFSCNGVVQFNHVLANEERQRRRRKSHGNIRAYEVPLWGKASEVVKLYENKR